MHVCWSPYRVIKHWLLPLRCKYIVSNLNCPDALVNLSLTLIPYGPDTLYIWHNLLVAPMIYTRLVIFGYNWLYTVKSLISIESGTLVPDCPDNLTNQNWLKRVVWVCVCVCVCVCVLLEFCFAMHVSYWLHDINGLAWFNIIVILASNFWWIL